MASLSKLRACQSTCSYYRKALCSIAGDVARPIQATSAPPPPPGCRHPECILWWLLMLSFWYLRGWWKYEEWSTWQWEEKKERRKEGGGTSELIFEWHLPIAVPKEKWINDLNSLEMVSVLPLLDHSFIHSSIRSVLKTYPSVPGITLNVPEKGGVSSPRVTALLELTICRKTDVNQVTQEQWLWWKRHSGCCTST